MKDAAKYDFKSSYRGSRGPHLNCLTKFTQTRREEDRKGLSIHPRNWFSVKRTAKVEDADGVRP